ncbi:phytase [Epilithonimonas ginsengisoli]|uniref:Phytase n=2 Tax=Epilithonimonas ginsengisoli TaxID=1245592 RepID=A0ABU4JJJ4_9FLAO|nr:MULTISPECIES: phytase [Chryseobacterium group]MBV6880980.1 phytase [Epilithonimonas sp. FP105]MDW8549869.1 phytase [Epilithonimonas ginsengisoli]OAH73541.1 3-phytase [Chryseobacterium sp. FP211-J200]
MKRSFVVLGMLTLLTSCSVLKKNKNALKPDIITEKVMFDTDDPAIWINPDDASKSIIVGTDKLTDGGLYAFDLEGKIINKVTGLGRPNNVDIGYGLSLNGKLVDFAAVTERDTDKVRIYSLPELKEIGEFSVFDGEELRSPMGISVYKDPESKDIYVIVGRKTGPSDQYLWQYRLSDDQGKIKADVVRKLGQFSGLKEIESIAVDAELGFIYYSDEMFGVHVYHADPAKGDEEILLFGQGDFKRDIEGISIYPTGKGKGYILISNQQADTFNVYLREDPAKGKIAEVPFSTSESDGSEVTAIPLGDRFPKGVLVAMSNGKVFHYYDWRKIEEQITKAR